MKALIKRTMNMPLVIAASGAGTMEAVQVVTEQAQSPETVQLILQILIGIVTLVKLWKQKPTADEKNEGK
jgi:hypothetical protein